VVSSLLRYDTITPKVTNSMNSKRLSTTVSVNSAILSSLRPKNLGAKYHYHVAFKLCVFVKSKLKPGVRSRSVGSASAVRQARVRFSARHPMEVLLLVSKEAMKIQEDRP
jgi:hypothetical protein